MSGIGIMGGTFNPVHIGHIRHAVEVGEALGLDKVLLTPAAVPPHKSGRGLLPFALRVELVRAAVAGVPRLGVNTLEGELDGPSYTYVSLEEWRKRHGVEPYFLMGVEDFTALDSWYRGLELPRLAHLVVVPRAGSDRDIFRAAVRRYWPDGILCACPVDTPPAVCRETVRLPGGGLCTFLSVPRLDVSASFVRERWLAGRELHGLLPGGALAALVARREEVDHIWAGADVFGD